MTTTGLTQTLTRNEGGRLRRLAADGLALLREWRRRARARAELARIQPRDLRDAGFSTAFVDYELGRRFWQPLLRLRW